MIYPLHGRNTKKLKNQKPKLLIFFVNTHILVKLFQKKPKYQYILELMIYPLDCRNTKKLKNQKPKLLIFL